MQTCGFLLFHQTDTKPFQLKLFWVPGHLDTVKLKRPRHIPDVWFALNHAADHLASQVAETFEVPLHLLLEFSFTPNW